MQSRTLVVVLATISMVILSFDAIAGTRTTSQSGNWSATSTWGGNPAPVAGDDVIVNGGFTVSVDVGNAACLSIQLGGSILGTGSGTLAFSGGSHLIVAGQVTLGVTTNTPGTLTMAGGGTLSCEGLVVNRLGTWTAGSGTIEFTATNSVPNDNNINFNNLTISGGTTTLTRNVTVAGNLLITTGGLLDGGTNVLTVGGDWTNDGTFTGNTGTVTFDKNGSQSITGNGTNNFNLIKVNLGTSSANTLEVSAAHFSAPDAFLTLTNGTFKISGTFTFANSFLVGPIYNIQPTAGLWINNPNVTVTAQAGGASVRGLLRISAGTYNIGTSADHSLLYVAGSSIILEGGSLHIAGVLAGNNATATTTYTQSGGTVTVVEQGSTDPASAGFDLGAAGSSFTMSGGTIVVENSTSGPADFRNLAGTASVTGGLLQIGDAMTLNAQTIRIQSARPVGSLKVSGATVQTTKPVAQLLVSTLNVGGSVTIDAGTTLNANGFNITLGGNWSDSGSFSGGSNTVIFNGPGAQTLTASGGETFSGLSANKPGGVLAFNNSVTVNSLFGLTLGPVDIGGTTLTLNGTVTGGGTLSSAAGGTVRYNQGSAGQGVLPGKYGNLAFSDFNKTLPSSDTVGVAGVFTPGAATGHTSSGSTIDFQGGSQGIPSFPYNNLVAGGSGVKSSTGILTINGNLTVNPGVTFTGASVTLDGPASVNHGTLSTDTLAVGLAALLTNNDSLAAIVSLSGAGTLVQGPSGKLNIGGSVTLANFDASAAGNNVNYSGANQTLATSTYHHLTLSGSGTPNLAGMSAVNGNFTLSGTVNALAAGALSIGGNVSIGGLASFDAGPYTHTLKGNWSNAGAFIAGSGTITFNGTIPQTIGGTAFNNIVIDNAAGISMVSDETIGGTFTMTSGGFSIGSHTLTLNGDVVIGGGTLVGGPSSNLAVGGPGGPAAIPPVTVATAEFHRPSGATLAGDLTVVGTLTVAEGTLATGPHSVILGPLATLVEQQGRPVLGTVRSARNVAAVSGVESFGNIGVEIAMNGAAPGNTSVVRRTGTLSSGGGHTSIARMFDISPANNTGLNAGLIFHYDTSETGGQVGSILELYRSRDTGATWNNFGGIVDTASRTISVAGLNELSRWTAADTNNRLGATPVPSTSGILPSTRNAGAPGFTLTVNGSDFVSGKSIVRFNGSDRVTTYVSSAQLTANILTGDLAGSGTFPVTVFNGGGGGLSNAQSFVVLPLSPAKIQVETAPDGSGSVVSAQALSSASSLTVYAVTRDSLNNFLANVTAGTWTLENLTGGVVQGDLVASGDKKSAVFSAHLSGSAVIRAASGSLAATPSGTITVVPGPLSRFSVEASGGGPVAAQLVGVWFDVRITAQDSSGNTVTSFNEPVDVSSPALLTSGGGTTPALANGILASHAVTIGSTGSTTLIATRSHGGAQSGTSNAFDVRAVLTHPLNKGWNIISVPLTVADYSKTVLYPTALTGAFGYEGSYSTHAVLANGIGYWLKYGAADTVRLSGFNRSTDTVSVSAGWNLVGSISTPLAAQNVVTIPPGIPTTKFYGYSGSYATADTIRPGFGYWIKVSQSGKLILSSSSSPSATASQRINILATNELPPPPPIETGNVSADVPEHYAMGQNYPNPFNPTTTLAYALPEESRIRLTIYNVLGQHVATLVDGVRQAGEQEVVWDAGNVGSGVYFYRLEAASLSNPANTFNTTGRMLLVK